LQILEEFCKSGTLSLQLHKDWLIEDYAADFGLGSADEMLSIIQKLIEAKLLDSGPWENARTLFSSEFIENNRPEINRKIRQKHTHHYLKHQSRVFDRDGHSCSYCGSTKRLTSTGTSA
jgi:hypothetical protein